MNQIPESRFNWNFSEPHIFLSMIILFLFFLENNQYCLVSLHAWLVFCFSRPNSCFVLWTWFILLRPDFIPQLWSYAEASCFSVPSSFLLLPRIQPSHCLISRNNRHTKNSMTSLLNIYFVQYSKNILSHKYPCIVLFF